MYGWLVHWLVVCTVCVCTPRPSHAAFDSIERLKSRLVRRVRLVRSNSRIVSNESTIRSNESIESNRSRRTTCRDHGSAPRCARAASIHGTTTPPWSTPRSGGRAACDDDDDDDDDEDDDDIDLDLDLDGHGGRREPWWWWWWW